MATKNKRRRKAGEGSLFKNPNSNNWYMSYWVDGRRKTISTGTPDKDDAQLELDRKLVEIRLAAPDIPATEMKWSFEELSRKWLKIKLASGISPSAKNELRVIVENHLIPALGHKDLHAIKPDLLSEFLSAKLTGFDYEGNKLPVKGGSESKPQSVSYTRKQMQVLSTIFNYAQKNGLYSAHRLNPVSQVDMKALQGQTGGRRAILLNEVLEDSEVKELFRAAQDPQEELLYRLLAQLGLRIGEALSLKVSDYDPKTKTLNIARTQRRNINVAANSDLNYVRPEGPHLYTSDGQAKTNAGLRQLSVKGNKELDRLIRKQIASPERIKRIQNEDWLLVSEKGTMLSPGTLRKRRWAQARKKAGLSDQITFHTLRHTFASHQIANGTPITQLSYWLGHANAQITFTVYAHILRKHSQEDASVTY